MNKMRLTTAIVVTLLTIGTTQINAQEQPVTLGVKAGVNLSTFGGNVNDAKTVFKYQVGVTADIAVTENFYILTGLDFQTKGSKYKPKEGSDIKYNPMYLQVPVHVGYKFELSPDFKLVVNAGPYAAYGIGGKVKGSGVSESLFGDNKLKRFDYGVGAGIGVEYNRICLNVGYDFGLANISDAKGGKIRNRNAFITLGYKF